MKNFIDKNGKGRRAGDASSGGSGTISHSSQEVKRKILVVGKGETLDPAAIDYAVNLAERLGAKNMVCQGVNYGY